MQQDHPLNECAEVVEISPGVYTRKRCEECRKKMFSLRHSIERRNR
jgi:hypothetical protein